MLQNKELVGFKDGGKSMYKTDLQAAVGNQETIIWKGKPQKKCFILESIFNPMLPIALVWGMIDFGFLGASLFAGEGKGGIGAALFLIPFFALHLMPVWMYLGGVILTMRRYRNTEYIITNLGVYISGGSFSYTYEMKPFAELSHISIHRGIFDQNLGVGDVELSSSQMDFYVNRNRRVANQKKFAICNVENYQEIYQIVKQLQTDIYSDTMYPNDMRPETNHGYQTQYTRIDELKRR